MRRADRLFQIVQLLRNRRLTTAADLARELEVSTRTVYRDIQDLLESRVPIEGEAGVGYRLRKGYELAPMTFNIEELQALVFGARLVQAWADPELGSAVRSAMSKIEGVLPEPLQQSMLNVALFAPPGQFRQPESPHLSQVRSALTHEHWLDIKYCDGQGVETDRRVVPLALYFWGPVWLVAAYCLLRRDYRTFRADRILSAEPVEAASLPLDRDGSPVCLNNYLRRQESYCDEPPAGDRISY